MAGKSTLAAVMAIVAMVQPVTAQAQPCWSSDMVGAARLREMEVMLMAVGLRCSSLNYDIMDSLERFRTTHEVTIKSAEAKLRGHFGAHASGDGKLQYDRFLTRLGNSYGSGATDLRTCQMFKVLTDELTLPGANAESVAMIALDLVRDPQIEGESCAVTAAAGK